ncbi:probable 39S ribosomal protein L49, mitochondrial [Solenopsis invicta]|uniref:probable 39S ribosomal protein L49, mitochondrial n=1 Tax=Solenopsis invicta TaxID=13686 RepID=UPI00193CF2FE|nr:probable 39S ribosomal protein L49, mitochondrial [Solenopsis invicta]
MAALRQIFARGNLAALSIPVARRPLNRLAPLIPQIQQRWSSYKSSSKYTTPEDYTDYDITKDPNEWKYVERVLGYKIIPKPPTGNVKLPSGYKLASAAPTNYPYFIERTKNYMQPVYLTRNPRGYKKITKIAKIQGDIWALERDMKQYVEECMKKKIASQIHEFAGVIKFKGDCVNRVKEWMDMKGF